MILLKSCVILLFICKIESKDVLKNIAKREAHEGNEEGAGISNDINQYIDQEIPVEVEQVQEASCGGTVIVEEGDKGHDHGDKGHGQEDKISHHTKNHEDEHHTKHEDHKKHDDGHKSKSHDRSDSDDNDEGYHNKHDDHSNHKKHKSKSNSSPTSQGDEHKNKNKSHGKSKSKEDGGEHKNKHGHRSKDKSDDGRKNKSGDNSKSKKGDHDGNKSKHGDSKYDNDDGHKHKNHNHNKHESCDKDGDNNSGEHNCKENEEYRKCGNPCEDTCKNALRHDRPCVDRCGRAKCTCKDGFVRNSEGSCVNIRQCPRDGFDCPQNEVVNGCGNLCEPQCNKPHRVCPQLCGLPACVCKSDYVRHGSVCVPNQKCVDLLKVAPSST